MAGNSKTRDEVLRREMRQMESAWASTSQIERSKTRLERLGYFDSVNVETPPVVGAADQIDVNYTVAEKASGNLMAGVGFSQTQGIVFNANVSQDNVFGSGKRVNLAFNNSNISTEYSFGFLNPYFTTDGVSLGYDLGYRTRNAAQANISRYNTNTMNAGLNFGIPLNEFDRLGFYLDLKRTRLRPSDISSQEVVDFISQNQGSNNTFDTLSTSISWSHNSLNRLIMPSEGGQQRLTALATVPGSDLLYYKADYNQQHYFPLAKDLTIRLRGEVAYGGGYGKTDKLPFFENYFNGGVRSVWYNDNTLGPRDSKGLPIGGSSKVVGNAELFFPVPFVEEVKSVRLGVFFDAGSVSNGFDSGLSKLKYSTGVSGEWLSPFGALAVSLAYPINAVNNDPRGFNDNTKWFQFTFGQGF